MKLKVSDFEKGKGKEKIAVVGLGYVGLPLAVLLDKKFNVVGYDISKERIEELKKGVDRTREVSKEELLNSDVEFTNNPKKLSECKSIIITVPTPIDEHKIPDLRPIKSATTTVGKYMPKGSVIVYESTVYPGLTEEECVPILEKESGYKWKVDFNVGYSPERVNPGDKKHTIDKIVKVVAGDEPEITDFLAELYGSVITAGIHKAPDIKTAEAAKVIENTQRDLNIALMNELSLIFHKLGIDTKEVLEAAATKWNFLRFEPGLVGGHCQIGSEYIFVKDGDEIIETTFEEFVDKNLKTKRKINYYGTEFFIPEEEYGVMSFNPYKEEITFEKPSVFTKRKYNRFVKIKTSIGTYQTVSDKHPVIVKNGDSYDVKLANELKVGDEIPVITKLPTVFRNEKINLIDLIKNTPLAKKVRIKIKNKSWKDFRNLLTKENLGKKVSNFLYGNYLPFEDYLKIRKEFKKLENEENLELITRKGNSFGKIPAVFKIDKNFARFVGYYLSEGCLTKEAKTSRIRISINPNEKELLKDLTSILESWGISYSIYKDKNFDSLTLKISNQIFAYMIETLKCGKDSYDAKIPSKILYNTEEIRYEVLKGLFRGDSGFSANKITYFSSSPKLFQQVILLLHNFEIFPFVQKREGLLEIYAREEIEKFRDIFLDDKKKKLIDFLKNRKTGKTQNYYKKDGFLIAKVKEVQHFEKEENIYSLEVPKTKNYITTCGIMTHNCIGVDPYYLTFKAEALGHHPEVILAGRRINDNMGKFVAESTVKLMIKAGKAVKGTKVLILGITFKENISDVRNTRVIDVYNELLEYGVDVYVYDPYAYPDEVKKEYGIDLLDSIEAKAPYDTIIVAVRHGVFLEELDFKKFKELSKEPVPILVDIKGLYDRKKAEKEGFLYWRL